MQPNQTKYSETQNDMNNETQVPAQGATDADNPAPRPPSTELTSVSETFNDDPM